jgi:hypothetical protein
LNILEPLQRWGMTKKLVIAHKDWQRRESHARSVFGGLRRLRALVSTIFLRKKLNTRSNYCPSSNDDVSLARNRFRPRFEGRTKREPVNE